MTSKYILPPNTPVRVRNCRGIARVVSQVRGYGVYLLDRPMAVLYKGDKVTANKFVAYWTFPRADLKPVEVQS